MSVIKFPIYRPDIQQVAEEIKKLVYERCSGLSVAESIGVLETIKLEIFNEQM